MSADPEDDEVVLYCDPRHPDNAATIIAVDGDIVRLGAQTDYERVVDLDQPSHGFAMLVSSPEELPTYRAADVRDLRHISLPTPRRGAA